MGSRSTLTPQIQLLLRSKSSRVHRRMLDYYGWQCEEHQPMLMLFPVIHIDYGSTLGRWSGDCEVIQWSHKIPIRSAAKPLMDHPLVYLCCMCGSHSGIINGYSFLEVIQTWIHCSGISGGKPNLPNNGGRILREMVLKNFVNQSLPRRMGKLHYVLVLAELQFIPDIHPSLPGSEPWTDCGATLLMLGTPVGTMLW